MTTDIVEAIDAELEEGVGNYRAGEYEIAYLRGDYERCWHCGRHWHGLPLTARVAQMYAAGRYDPDYSPTDDNSTIICEGSTFIGPQRPTPAVERRELDFTLHFDGSSLFDGIMDAFQNMLGHFQEFGRQLERAGLIDWSDWFGPTDTTLTQWWHAHCVESPTIEFGIQWWHHEIDAARRRGMQFPRTPGIYSPLERAVLARWDLFNVEIIPAPEPRPVDWTAITKQLDHEHHAAPKPPHPRDHTAATRTARPRTAPRRQQGRRRA